MISNDKLSVRKFNFVQSGSAMLSFVKKMFLVFHAVYFSFCQIAISAVIETRGSAKSAQHSIMQTVDAAEQGSLKRGRTQETEKFETYTQQDTKRRKIEPTTKNRRVTRSLAAKTGSVVGYSKKEERAKIAEKVEKLTADLDGLFIELSEFFNKVSVQNEADIKNKNERCNYLSWIMSGKDIILSRMNACKSAFSEDRSVMKCLGIVACGALVEEIDLLIKSFNEIYSKYGCVTNGIVDENTLEKISKLTSDIRANTPRA